MLELTSIMLAGGAGPETALEEASSRGHGWGFRQFSAEMARARNDPSLSPFLALRNLGVRFAVSELEEFGNVMILSSENAATVRQAFDMLAMGGTATVIGMVPSKDVVQLRGIDFLQEKKLQGSMMGSNQFRTDIPRMIDMYLAGRLLLDEMVSATIGLEGVNEGYEMMKRGEVARTVITFD